MSGELTSPNTPTIIPRPPGTYQHTPEQSERRYKRMSETTLPDRLRSLYAALTQQGFTNIEVLLEAAGVLGAVPPATDEDKP